MMEKGFLVILPSDYSWFMKRDSLFHRAMPIYVGIDRQLKVSSIPGSPASEL